jgi:hypothetical protein
MSDCPSRYLAADGFVLACRDHEGCDKTEGFDSCGCHYCVGHMDLTRTSLTWESNDPCVWDATCTTCVLGVVPSNPSAENDEDRVSDCPDCKGTGVDEKIPLHLIGIGSRLSREDRTDLIIVGKMDDIAFCVEPDGHAHQLIELAAIGRVWTVARAVPPAHTPND